MNATEAQPASKASAPQRVVRIGGASGFWGDSCVGAPQLLAAGWILVFDYLAELTLSILAAARSKTRHWVMPRTLSRSPCGRCCASCWRGARAWSATRAA